MKAVTFENQHWFFSNKGNFQGLRTGSDACAEHEWGMKPIQRSFGLDLDLDSLDRFKITRKPENLFFFDEKLKKERFVGILLSPNHFSTAKDIAKQFEHYSWDKEPVIAWDERSFLIMVPADQKKYVKAIKALWQAMEDGNLWLGGFAENRKYIGSGIGFFLPSSMSIDAVKAENEALKAKAEDEHKLAQAVEKEGFEDVKKQLTEARRHWFALRPKHVRDDGSVHYWLNPMDQKNHHFGFVTIEDLRHWVKGKGRIPNRMAD